MTDRPNRILEIPESELNSAQRKVFDDLVAGRGRLLTPYKIWIHSPEVAAGGTKSVNFFDNPIEQTRRMGGVTSS